MLSFGCVKFVMAISPPNGEADWRNMPGDLVKDKIWGVLGVLNPQDCFVH